MAIVFIFVEDASKAVPLKLLDTCAFIRDLLGELAWKAKLKKHHKLLTDVFSKQNDKKIVHYDEVR